MSQLISSAFRLNAMQIVKLSRIYDIKAQFIAHYDIHDVAFCIPVFYICFTYSSFTSNSGKSLTLISVHDITTRLPMRNIAGFRCGNNINRYCISFLSVQQEQDYEIGTTEIAECNR